MDVTNRQEKLDRVIGQRREGVMVLQDIHDPHNAAAVWRSIDAFGWQKVYLIFEQEEVFNPKKMGRESSASANKWLDFKVFKSTRECIEELHREGYGLWATVLDREASEIYESKFEDKKIAIMLGNEHRGLTEEAVKLADRKVYIPMRGMVQSLNLSVSAAICLYEVERQREESDGEFGLSDVEKIDLEKRWR
ncbi:RNA methyltransferase [Candidatus Shapirobacteria bacterium]|nr:RNA methyltransferase [Candidatus Shapirobacteria bacterium]